MKRIVLLTVLLPVFAFSQTYQKVNNNTSQVAPLKQVPLVTDRTPIKSVVVKQREMPENKKITSRGSKYTPVAIGYSQYDLQTNASIGRRILVYPDGKMSAVWTTCPDEGPKFETRGTGYNHFDGTTWFAPVEKKLELTRAGWPNIGTFKAAGVDVEYIMSHYASSNPTDPSGGIVLNINGGIGQTIWAQTFLDQASGPIWHRTAECGKYVCIISTYSDSMKYVNGVRQPTVYSRYNSSTKTFDQKYVMLPGYDTLLTKLGRGDDYTIDAKGSTVDIVMAPYFGHVVLWKSTDSGATFTKIMIDSAIASVPKFDGDTQFFYLPDGSVSVIVDNEGYCKAVWSYYKGFRDSISSTSTRYYKFLHGLRYWDEKNDTILNIPTAQVWDRNKNGTLDIGSAIANEEPRLGGDGLNHLIDAYGITNPLLSFPQITIDDAGNIFVIYSAMIEDAFYLGVSYENLRDVYVVYSTNQGLTWGPQQNISNNFKAEDVFASVSKNCYGDKLHIIFQEDEDPGTSTQNYDPYGNNTEYYVEVPISDILGNLIGPGDSIGQVGINDKVKSFEIGNNYPNPFTGETYIDVKLTNMSNVVVTMNNVLGQQVLENSYSNVPSGKRTLSIDGSGLKSGIYFLNVKVGSEVKTIKTMVR